MDDDDFSGNTKEQQELIDQLRDIYDEIELCQIKKDLAMMKAAKVSPNWADVAKKIIGHYATALQDVFGQEAADQFRSGVVESQAAAPVSKTVN